MTQAQSPYETLLLKQPTINSGEIVFLYAGDLWIAGQDGSHPRRLTAQKGRKGAPHFSPDGAWIAFSANYDGNMSVYVLSREGGSPRRLTYHPYEDWVRGWTPDGSRVLFSSSRDSVAARVRRLYTVSLDGMLPEPLPMHMADRGAYSPDARRLAYTAYAEAFWSWKRYRGGMTVPIWVLDMTTYDHVEIPHENASDTFPCWIGSSVYFLSDRRHTMNIFRWDSQTNAVEQVTFYDDFDVRSLTVGDGMLAFEQAGKLHLFDPNTGKTTDLSISIAADLPYTRPRFERAERFIQNFAISPTGKRVVFEARGDIFTTPVKKGDPRNITRTPGAADRYPAWSPDGQSIAYFSDASGEYELVISDQKGVQKKTISLENPSFFYSPIWSPDSRKIAFTDKFLRLYYVDVKTKVVTLVDEDAYEHPIRSLNPVWSPDSQWLAYTKRLDNHIRAVFLYNLEQAQAHQVTDGMSDATDACFSRDGKHLYFAASSDYGLNTGWLDMSSYERPITRSLYVAVLNCDDSSPLSPESDEEEAPEEKKEAQAEKPDNNGKEAADSADDGEPKDEHGEKKDEFVKVKIDLADLDQRILALPVPARYYENLQSADHRLFYMELLPNQTFDNDYPSFRLKVYDFKERKEEEFLGSIKGYVISADGKKLLYREGDRPRFVVVDTDKKPEGNGKNGTIDLSRMEVYIDPRAEWQQIFREAYRIHRDFFYDAELHGLDLQAMVRKYEPFLSHLGHRDDLNYLLAEFSGELVVGHAYVGMGDIPSADYVPVGLLGADYEVTADGYYRIRRIYPGLNWHPELRSPLTEPGVNVREGEYILAVNGQPLRSPDNIYRLFQKTADRITDLLVSPSTDPAEGRVVSVKPVASETALRHWTWVENNRKKVDELSNGRVAYVYLPNTAVEGYTNFNRYYFSQLNKQAVVLDERFNGGGSVADYIIDLLDRRLLSYWATRSGKTFATPNASIFGPKVMIINELAGSGGDALPMFFRRRGLGKLVGKRTWGGLIGIYDYPPLIDGGFFTSPRLAIFSPDGQWEVENEGVAPDIEVEMTPKLVVEGRDPQLEKAVEVVLAELEASPPVKASRPAPAYRAVER